VPLSHHTYSRLVHVTSNAPRRPSRHICGSCWDKHYTTPVCPMGTCTCSSVARAPSGHISRWGVHVSYLQCLQPQSEDCSDTRANDGHLKAILHFRVHREIRGDSLVDAATWGKRDSLAKGMAMYTLLHINANRLPNIYGLESLQEGYSNVETIMGHNCPTPKFRGYS